MPRSIAPLFQSGRGDIRTIPAGADFLTELAQGLFSALANPDDPAALSRATIYLPNRRSVRALEMAFLEASGHAALMLPSIRTLGDLDRQEPVFAFEAPPDRLLPPASNAMRLGHLAQLVVAFQNSRGIPISPLSALNSAKELAGLLDQIAMSDDVDWSKLSDMLETVDLAQHWKESAQFLGIIVEQWPAFLSESGRIDPAAYQRALAESIAQIWQDTAPASPIIIAGSTGANASTRALMKAASGLPNGLIVLPGLSDTANEAENAAILSAPSHPQFTLQRTLQSLGVSPETVMNWPDVRLGEAQSARNRFVQDALAPAALTASWGQRSIDLTESGTVDDAVKAATDGLALIEAGNDTEEAELAALLLRESLQREGERTALVTLDMGLALRVSAQLKALGIDCQPSAGTPLLQTMLGSAILELAELLEDPSHPIRLISALRLPLGKFTEDSVLAFDKHVLRGPRLWKDLAGLERHANAVLSSQRCAATSDEAQYIRDLMEALKGTLSPVEQLGGRNTQCFVSTYVDHLSALVEAWTDGATASDAEAASVASQRLIDLGELGQPLGAMPLSAFVDLLRQDFFESMVPPSSEHPSIAIWGPLEARLQSANHIILAGLNEEHWPAQPAADSFLSRRFRTSIGLTDPDERIGLSAHDFAQLVCTRNTTLLSAKRRDGKPAVASRWLWRLRTLIRGAAGDALAETLLMPDPDRDPRTWLSAIRGEQRYEPIDTRPRPCPPIAARPKRLSITRIETLIRDPYAVYCESILGLSRLDPPGQPADARHMGTAIHGALERFELEGGRWTPAQLLEEIERALASKGIPDVDLLALREKRRDVVASFLEWRRSTTAGGRDSIWTEVRGAADLNIGSETFSILGVADRVQRQPNGDLSIFDYKIGAPPSLAQVKAGLSPQLPLLALIARRGGFQQLPKNETDVTELAYIRFGTSFDLRTLGEPIEVDQLIEETHEGVSKLLERFMNPEHPFLSAPRPHRLAYPSEYARLARRDEWGDHTAYD